MGNMYRILIESGDGEMVADLTAPVEMLAQFAPDAVARLLREATPEVEGDTPSAPKFTDAEPVKRRRRTKAEMAEVRAAERLADPNSLDEAPDQAATQPEAIVPDQSGYNPFAK